MHFDLSELIQTAGYLGLFAIIFAESGLFIGFFLPGDSLLFTAGILASQGHFQILPLVLVCFVAAVLGDNFGYAFGRKVGPALFTKEDSWLFNKKHLLRANEFYKKYGKITIVLARFTPFVRTFAPILAGVGKMHYPTFLAYNLFGGLVWGVGLPILGYELGQRIPNIHSHLTVIVMAIIIFSVLPPIYHVFKERRANQAKPSPETK